MRTHRRRRRRWSRRPWWARRRRPPGREFRTRCLARWWASGAAGRRTPGSRGRGGAKGEFVGGGSRWLVGASPCTTAASFRRSRPAHTWGSAPRVGAGVAPQPPAPTPSGTLASTTKPSPSHPFTTPSHPCTPLYTHSQPLHMRWQGAHLGSVEGGPAAHRVQHPRLAPRHRRLCAQPHAAHPAERGEGGRRVTHIFYRSSHSKVRVWHRRRWL